MTKFKDVDDILMAHGTSVFKITDDGLVAVHANGRWKYYKYDKTAKQYKLHGTTLKFSR